MDYGEIHTPMIATALLTQHPIWGTLYIVSVATTLPIMLNYTIKPILWLPWIASVGTGFYILTQP